MITPWHFYQYLPPPKLSFHYPNSLSKKLKTWLASSKHACFLALSLLYKSTTNLLNFPALKPHRHLCLVSLTCCSSPDNSPFPVFCFSAFLSVPTATHRFRTLSMQTWPLGKKCVNFSACCHSLLFKLILMNDGNF